jgi:hypothetical protein
MVSLRCSSVVSLRKIKSVNWVMSVVGANMAAMLRGVLPVAVAASVMVRLAGAVVAVLLIGCRIRIMSRERGNTNCEHLYPFGGLVLFPVRGVHFGLHEREI